MAGMRYQPQGVVRLNTSHPLAKNIDIAFVSFNQPSVVNKITLTKFGSPLRVAKKFGVGSEFFAGTDYYQMSGAPSLPDGTEYSWLTVFQPTSLSATGFFVNGDNTTRMFQFRHNGANPEFILFAAAGGVAGQSTGTAITVGSVNNILARVSATEIAMFQNGRRTNSTGYIATIKGQTSPNEIQIGMRSGNYAQGAIGLTVRWNRALTDDEAKLITSNPWQLFEYVEEYDYPAVAGGGTSYSYTASGGMVLSGASTRVSGAIRQTTGGVALSGASNRLVGAVRNTTGGVVMSGNATVVASGIQSRIINALGGMTFSGTSLVQRTLSRIASGGVLFGGTAGYVSGGLVEQFFGTLNDVITQYLESTGKTGAFNDMLDENEYWRALGGTGILSLNDVKKIVLNSLGKTGTLNDMEKKYWEDK